MDSYTFKKAVRTDIKKRAEKLSDEYFSDVGNGMSLNLFHSIIWKNSQTVFCFVSTPREPDTLGIIWHALEQGKKVCVPRITGKQMEAVYIDSLKYLRKGKYGIDEPSTKVSETANPEDIDLILMPCTTASRNGARLGKGGGYYDRFLSGFKGITCVLCPDALLSPPGSFPMDDRDRYADYVLTELELFQSEMI